LLLWKEIIMYELIKGGKIRLGIYTLSEVFAYFDASPQHGQKIKFYGHKIYMRNPRLSNFRINGIKCVACAKIGAFFAAEKFNKYDAIHLNLYGFDKSGNELLFTRDHIKPKVKGGTNRLYNMQTMCSKCNNIKGNQWNLSVKALYYFRKTFCGRMAKYEDR